MESYRTQPPPASHTETGPIIFKQKFGSKENITKK